MSDDEFGYDCPEAKAFRAALYELAVLTNELDVEAGLARLHAWMDGPAYGDPVADLDKAAVIAAALDRGWRPDPAVQPGVTIADCLNQGDKFGRYWTLTDPRELNNSADQDALNAAADAATTFLNSRREEK